MRKRTQPDKSIITMDAACGWHNMFRGDTRELSMDAIYMMVAKETGLNPMALSDGKIDRGEIYDPTKNKVDAGAINFQDTDGDKRFESEEKKEAKQPTTSGFQGPGSSIKSNDGEAAE